MFITRFLVAITMVAGITFTVGCDSGQPTSVMEDADLTAIEAYEKAEAEEQAKLAGEMTDAVE